MKLFDSFFFKLFLITNFKNTENIILMFFKNYFCSMNIILFYIFFVFFEKKNQICFSYFSYSSYLKTITKQTIFFR